jgi:HK97 family phage portal protein
MSILLDKAFDLFLGFSGYASGFSTHYGVFEAEAPDTRKEVEPQNMSTVYMCTKILSSTISMMPLEIKKKDKLYKKHDLYYNLRYRMSDNQNNQVFWSTIEYMRNIYGNAFVDIRKNKFDIIPIEIVDDWDFKGTGGKLRYHLNWALELEKFDKRTIPVKSEWVDAKDILHFKGMSADGVMGLPPVMAAFIHMKIMDKASNTLTSFYDNRAMSPMSLESTLPDGAGASKIMIEQMEKFQNKYSGTSKSGKTIHLPPNTKLTPLQLSMVDAELINTLRFSRDEICNMYGIPSFMHNSSADVQMDIEMMTRSFQNFTIQPISKIYQNELEYKLLKKEEVINDVSISFDTLTLIQLDFSSQATAFKGLIQSGVVSPNMAAEAMRFEKSKDPYADQRFVQAQLIALGDYAVANPIINNKDKSNTDKPDGENEKKEDNKSQQEKE